MTQQTKQRPFVITILAILAGIAAVFAAVHFLQALGILPYFFGAFKFRDFNLWYALMWGLMVWVWVWLVRMLWNVDRQAWLFLAVIAVFNLILDTTALLFGGVGTSFSDYSVSFILNGLILLYVMLPSTKRAFDVN
jgi:hypothetical protein